MTASSSLRYRRASHVAWRRVGDEPVVINLDRKQLYGLNGAGGAVWDALEEAASAAELAAGLTPGDPLADPEAVVGAFLAELCEHGLVEPATDAASAPAAHALGRLGEAPAVSWSEPVARTVQLPSQIYAVGDPKCGY